MAVKNPQGREPGGPSSRGRGRNKDKPLPPVPTKAIPGTEEKIQVLRWRVRRGYRCFHHLDYREDRNPT